MAPQSAVPPTLPPSVEEAYRRKCVQLRNRTNEVEESNDAARLRLTRLKRQVEKLRVERAFLLEQLAKRTSTNVEDSDGSPSPPPTDPHADFTIEVEPNPRKPQDKPLRAKKGGRKTDTAQDPSDHAGTPGGGAEASNAREDASVSNSGISGPVGLFYDEIRPALEDRAKAEEDLNMEEELQHAWAELSDSEKTIYQEKWAKLAALDKPEPQDQDLDEDVDMDVGDHDESGDRDVSPEKKLAD